ncbi:MAG TPA: hypothetical protein VM577_16630, partial [Anaerovoracaceae bacterium]|nr:hypothetical protein [Anaerovoracaceae bacterium]
KIIHGRVQFLCLSWTGANLPELGARLNGKKAICYYDPSDLGNILVSAPWDPHNPVRAEATDPEYQNGLTLTEHEKLKAAEKEDSLKYDFSVPHVALWQLRVEMDREYQLSLQSKIPVPKKVHTPTQEYKDPVANPSQPDTSSLAESVIILPVDHL